MGEINCFKCMKSVNWNEWVHIFFKWVDCYFELTEMILEMSEFFFQFEWNMFCEISEIETSSNVSIIDLIFKVFSLWIQIYKNIQNWSFHSKDIYHPKFQNEIKGSLLMGGDRIF